MGKTVVTAAGEVLSVGPGALIGVQVLGTHHTQGPAAAARECI